MTRPETVPRVRIYDLLYRLGLRAVSTDFFYTAHAVSLALERASLLFGEQRLYQEVAALYRSTPQRVRGGIGRCAAAVWVRRRGVLCLIARRKLSQCPSPVQFLTILAAYLTEDYAA